MMRYNQDLKKIGSKFKLLSQAQNVAWNNSTDWADQAVVQLVLLDNNNSLENKSSGKCTGRELSAFTLVFLQRSFK